ncbi:hypothetical protein KR054_006789 [Drosophila jambulina]|nr:hypothetical protein KR054_006789 [Drosophila jambulina]
MNWHVYILLGACGFQLGCATYVYDATGRLNLSASCPDTFCHIEDQLIAYPGTPAPQVRELHLTDCSREAVPWQVLNLMPRLWALFIRNCDGNRISEESLRPVANLTILSLEHASLGVLRDELFAPVPHLEILYLGHDAIKTVHSGAFRELAKLQVLVLEGNGIQDISAKTFDPLPELNSLDLSGNQLSNLRPDIFSKNTNLQQLLLNGNHLRTLLPEITPGLQGNLIKSLPEGVLHPLENLRLLNLSDNRISNITENVFARNLKLQKLFLSENPLTQLVFPTQEPQTFFRLLDLSRCTQLKELVLFSKVDTLILEESGVESLRISGNNSLLRLKAAESKLTHLTLGDPMSLIVLKLRGTPLGKRNVSQLLCNMRSLYNLDLSQNSIVTLPLSFNKSSRDLCPLPNLKFLNLSSNLLVSRQLESSVFGPQLASLDLSHNKLDSFSLEPLEAAHDLRSLFLEGNILTTFNYRSLYERHSNLTMLGFLGNNFSIALYNEMIEYFRYKDVDIVGIDYPDKAKNKQLEWSVYGILIVIFLIGVLACVWMYHYWGATVNCCVGCKWGERTKDTCKPLITESEFYSGQSPVLISKN